MSLRQVLSIYNAERQLSEDDTALLNTLRRFTEPERALLIEQLSDKPQKKPGKGRVSGGGKSKRATGMQAQLNTRLAEQERRRQEQKSADDDGGGSDVRCQFTRADSKPCHLLPDHNIHHLTTANEHHPFVPPAQSADSSSSPNNAGDSSTASSATGKGAASNVHHAGG